MRPLYSHSILMLLACLFFTQTLQAQCDTHIELQTQAEVDAFASTYGCTHLDGNLLISGTDITNLDGLSGLTSIENHLDIRGNADLISIEGLNNLTYVGGHIVIALNESLVGIPTFDELESVGEEIEISHNPTIESIISFNGLNVLNSHLVVEENAALTNLNAFQNVINAESYIGLHNNNVLATINASFANVISITEHLDIRGNANLIDISSLTNIAHIGNFLRIKNNHSLEDCCFVQCWIDAVEGASFILNNASSCNSLEDIATTCPSNFDCDRSYIDALSFYDMNENGVRDAGEYGLNLESVVVEPTPIYGTNSSEGVKTFTVDNGSYLVKWANHPYWQPTGNTTYLVNTTNGTTQERSFGLTPTTQFANVKGNLTSAKTRCSTHVSYWLTYENIGTTSANGLVEYTPHNLVELVSVAPAPDYIEDGTLYWNYENLLPTYSREILLTFQMPSSDYMGTDLYSEGFVYTHDDAGEVLEQNKFTHSSQLKCSYDPNDKLVTPEGVGNERYTAFGENFEYTIRFQNTGNDTALNIIIRDSLDVNLAWESFEVVASSHDVRPELNLADGSIAFYFDNIYLVDSTTNEVGSHGFVKYAIVPKADLPENTTIENTAYIYFDENPAIVTNTTLNTLVSEVPVHALPDVVDLPITNDVFEVSTLVYPNPTRGEVQVNLDLSGTVEDTPWIQIFDNQGQLVIRRRYNSRSISLNDQPNGIYLVQVLYGDRQEMQRVVLQR